MGLMAQLVEQLKLHTELLEFESRREDILRIGLNFRKIFNLWLDKGFVGGRITTEGQRFPKSQNEIRACNTLFPQLVNIKQQIVGTSLKKEGLKNTFLIHDKQ